MITKKVNPGQNVDNIFSITSDGSPSDKDAFVTKKSTVTFPVAENFVSFSVKNLRTGANEVFPITGNVRQSIAQTLSEIGYNTSGTDSFMLENDGTNIIFAFVGDIDLVNVVTNIGTKTPVVTTTKVLMCDYTIAYDGDVSPAKSTFEIDGTETEFAASLVYGTASTSTVKTAFQTPALAGGAKRSQ